jgi:hypothetical protein
MDAAAAGHLVSQLGCESVANSHNVWICKTQGCMAKYRWVTVTSFDQGSRQGNVLGKLTVIGQHIATVGKDVPDLDAGHIHHQIEQHAFCEPRALASDTVASSQEASKTEESKVLERTSLDFQICYM